VLDNCFCLCTAVAYAFVLHQDRLSSRCRILDPLSVSNLLVDGHTVVLSQSHQFPAVSSQDGRDSDSSEASVKEKPRLLRGW
jgi:hypothetical protein